MNHSGYLCLQPDNARLAYDFIDGDMVIHSDNEKCELSKSNFILTRGYDHLQYLFYTQVPVEISFGKIFSNNSKFQVDWMIKNYIEGMKYSEIHFSFSELQYFFQKDEIIKRDEEKITINLKPEVIKSFDVIIAGKKCKF